MLNPLSLGKLSWGLGILYRLLTPTVQTVRINLTPWSHIHCVPYLAIVRERISLFVSFQLTWVASIALF